MPHLPPCPASARLISELLIPSFSSLFYHLSIPPHPYPPPAPHWVSLVRLTHFQSILHAAPRIFLRQINSGYFLPLTSRGTRGTRACCDSISLNFPNLLFLDPPSLTCSLPKHTLLRVSSQFPCLFSLDLCICPSICLEKPFWFLPISPDSPPPGRFPDMPEMG